MQDQRCGCWQRGCSFFITVGAREALPPTRTPSRTHTTKISEHALAGLRAAESFPVRDAHGRQAGEPNENVAGARFIRARKRAYTRRPYIYTVFFWSFFSHSISPQRRALRSGCGTTKAPRRFSARISRISLRNGSAHKVRTIAIYSQPMARAHLRTHEPGNRAIS